MVDVSFQPIQAKAVPRKYFAQQPREKRIAQATFFEKRSIYGWALTSAHLWIGSR